MPLVKLLIQKVVRNTFVRGHIEVGTQGLGEDEAKFFIPFL